MERAGGVTVGVASDEPECLEVSQWKRRRLIAAGSDYIVGNYLCREDLVKALFS